MLFYVFFSPMVCKKTNIVLTFNIRSSVMPYQSPKVLRLSSPEGQGVCSLTQKPSRYSDSRWALYCLRFPAARQQSKEGGGEKEEEATARKWVWQTLVVFYLSEKTLCVKVAPPQVVIFPD